MRQNSTIEVVRGRMDDARADQVLAFWAAAGALSDAAARQRLDEVVCALRDEDGEIAGACSVYAADVPIVGGRRFWVFRSLLPDAAAEHLPAMIREAFAALEAEFDDAPGSPIGLCVLLDADAQRHRPEAVWAEPRMLYAGYLGDGRQVRIGYFDGARVGPGVIHLWDAAPLEGYRVEVFAEQDAVSGSDLIELWTREGVLPQAEAERRVDEVLLVVTDYERRPAGVCTAYLQHNEQLRMDLWYSRVFVAAANRQSHISLTLALQLRKHLEQRFVDGEDTRAEGVVFEVENEFINTYYPQAHWMPTDYTFVGENAHGVDVRVYYFPGARAPGSPQGST